MQSIHSDKNSRVVELRKKKSQFWKVGIEKKKKIVFCSTDERSEFAKSRRWTGRLRQACKAIDHSHARTAVESRWRNSEVRGAACYFYLLAILVLYVTVILVYLLKSYVRLINDRRRAGHDLSKFRTSVLWHGYIQRVSFFIIFDEGLTDCCDIDRYWVWN